MRTITLLSIAIVSAGLSVQAQSAAVPRDVEQISEIVAFADLNLERAEGAATLYQRIEEAANYVCGSGHRLVAAREYARVRACVDQAIGDAIEALNDRPLVVAAHLGATQPGPRRAPRRERRRT